MIKINTKDWKEVYELYRKNNPKRYDFYYWKPFHFTADDDDDDEGLIPLVGLKFQIVLEDTMRERGISDCHVVAVQ